MAANCARRVLRSSHSAKTFLSWCPKSFGSSSSSFTSGATKLGGFASAKPTSSSACFSRHKPTFFSRLPVELGCAQSLMPLHTVTASALLTSMLSLESRSSRWILEGLDQGS